MYIISLETILNLDIPTDFIHMEYNIIYLQNNMVILLSGKYDKFNYNHTFFSYL